MILYKYTADCSKLNLEQDLKIVMLTVEMKNNVLNIKF
mgnify:CR=1 FL=1